MYDETIFSGKLFLSWLASRGSIFLCKGAVVHDDRTTSRRSTTNATTCSFPYSAAGRKATKLAFQEGVRLGAVYSFTGRRRRKTLFTLDFVSKDFSMGLKNVLVFGRRRAASLSALMPCCKSSAVELARSSKRARTTRLHRCESVRVLEQP